MSLLTVNNLSVVVPNPTGEVCLVNDISFVVEPQSVFALVGGSGSGKTTTGLAIVRLLPEALKMKAGEIIYKGRNMSQLSAEEMRRVRGKEISMIFQEPLYAFNPVFKIGEQIDEVLVCHSTLNKEQRKERTLEFLSLVGIKDPVRIFQSYPHQLSGGLRQRAMIAQAVCAGPSLVIADEPTSNLDVTLQARILELFRKLKKELNITFLLITHDLGVVEHLADNVAVLSSGRLVESGLTQTIIHSPQEAYTAQLVAAFRG